MESFNKLNRSEDYDDDPIKVNNLPSYIVDQVDEAIKSFKETVPVPKKKKFVRSSVRWYGILKPKDKDKGDTRKALYESEILTDKSLIVCRGLEFKQFAKFNNYITFWKYHNTETEVSEQCYYEVITENQVQKPYFDIDIPIEEKSSEKALSLEDSNILLKQLTESILKVNLDIKIEDIAIFSSHTTSLQGEDTYTKKSYHIIVDNWCLTDHEDNEGFCNLVIENIDMRLRFCIDTLYKSIQQLRIFQSHKFKSNRIKIVAIESKWVPPDKPESKEHLALMILASSLVTNISYCHLLPLYKKPKPPRYIYSGDGIYLEEDEVKKAIDICAQFFGFEHGDDPSFPFKFIELKGGLICLKRFGPTFCKICDREHENENPYLVIASKNRDIYFHCRRAPREDRQLVGTLGSNHVIKAGEFEEIEEKVEELNIKNIPSIDSILGIVEEPVGPQINIVPDVIIDNNKQNIQDIKSILNKPVEIDEKDQGHNISITFAQQKHNNDSAVKSQQTRNTNTCRDYGDIANIPSILTIKTSTPQPLNIPVVVSSLPANTNYNQELSKSSEENSTLSKVNFILMKQNVHNTVESFTNPLTGPLPANPHLQDNPYLP